MQVRKGNRAIYWQCRGEEGQVKAKEKSSNRATLKIAVLAKQLRWKQRSNWWKKPPSHVVIARAVHTVGLCSLFASWIVMYSVHRAGDWKPWAVQHHPKQRACWGSHVFHKHTYLCLLPPHCLYANPSITDTPGLSSHFRIQPSQSPPTTSTPGAFWLSQVREHYTGSVQFLQPTNNIKALNIPQDTFGSIQASSHC